MPKNSQVPSYRLHKARNCAVVTIHGQNHYLGSFGSPESHARYAANIAEWQRTQSVTLPTATRSFTIGQLALAYRKFCQGYYVKHGEPTSQIHTENGALRALVALYETEQAADFGPLKLKNIQQHLVGQNLSRPTINKLTAAIKRTFKFAASEELIPAAVFHALQTVTGLKEGRCAAREPDPIEPVPNGTVEVTLPHVSPVVHAMIRLQLLTGMRPGEVCTIRPCDITMQLNRVWVYRPASHKTEHHDRERRIYIGPEGQEVLRRFIDRDSESFCFSPREADAWRRAELRAKRKSKPTPSQLARRPKANPQKTPGARFTVGSYRRAIERACEIAFGMPEALQKTPKFEAAERKETEAEKEERLRLAVLWRRKNCWNPNQLRHSRATIIREQFGVEAAQVVLGHSDPCITQIYAQKNFDLAAKIMQQIG